MIYRLVRRITQPPTEIIYWGNWVGFGGENSERPIVTAHPLPFIVTWNYFITDPMWESLSLVSCTIVLLQYCLSFGAKRLLLISRCLKGVENKGRINPTGGTWDLVTYKYKWAGRRFCNPPPLSKSCRGPGHPPYILRCKALSPRQGPRNFQPLKKRFFVLPCQNNMTGAVVAPSTNLIPS